MLSMLLSDKAALSMVSVVRCAALLHVYEYSSSGISVGCGGIATGPHDTGNGLCFLGVQLYYMDMGLPTWVDNQ